MEEISKFNINFDEIRTNFKFVDEPVQGKVGLTHKTGEKYKLLPYVANEKTLVSEFSGVVGAFSRIICDKDLSEKFNVEAFIEEVVEQVADFKGNMSKEYFKDIVKTMFIDNGELVDFDIKTINYIPSTNADIRIATFLYSVLMDKDLKEDIKTHYDREVDNIMYKLVLKSLPTLKDKETSMGEYNCYLPYVREKFIEDFKFIITNEELYKDSLKRFLEYYYMYYISQLVMKLNSFESADLSKPDALYYTLDWERTSKTRTAYQFGLEKIKKDIKSLFSHAVVLELLNHNHIEEALDYKKLAERFRNIEKNDINKQLSDLVELYKNQIKDVPWDGFAFTNRNSDVNGFEIVYELFRVVGYQFEESTRNRANESYSNWYLKFLQQNFAKRRGQLGYNLNMTEDDIILMTKICIKDKGKMKLNNLMKEFEQRGLFFDMESHKKIVQLYEKLNLLEKKSDSGDAQYVKSVL